MQYLFFVDCDGTLLNTEGIVTLRTKKVIEKLKKVGCIFVICTARPRYSAIRIKNECNADQYVISSNGVEVYDCEENKIIALQGVGKDTCIRIYELAEKYGARIVMPSKDCEYVNKISHSDKQIVIDDYKNIIKREDIKQLFITNENFYQTKELLSLIKNEAGITIINESFFNIAPEDYEGENWFSVVSDSVSKGKAIITLTKYLNIPLENTFAIGNDFNDISMFEVAGTSICTENAPEVIKRNVDYITKSNNEDGVAIILEKLLEEVIK